MEQTKKITFFSKEPLACPVCETLFHKEELLSGSGRLVAGEVTDELRRLYEPSKKYGAIFPLIYTIVVCPTCLFAVFPKDMKEQEAERETIQTLKDTQDKRLSSIGLLFPDIDFTQPRTLETGAASYFLAVMCYEHIQKQYSPTIKCGLSTLRAAWLFDELHRKKSDENYDYLNKLFYRKSRFYYRMSIEREQTGKETMGAMANLGPDLDKNYGYDGVLYIAAYLEFKYGPSGNQAVRIQNLDRAKKTIAKVHGMGRASKNRPSLILDMAKELYGTISDEHKSLQGEE